MSEAEDAKAIEAVARAIALSQTQDERLWQAFIPESIAALTVAKPVHEKALLRKFQQWAKPSMGEGSLEIMVRKFARDLGYGDISVDSQ